jgi:hypothetical protein
MARHAALVAASLAGVAGLIVAVVLLVRFLPAPVGPGAGNALQPLADDLTWVYGATSAPEGLPMIPYVIGITGHEQVGSGTSWLLQSWIGTTSSTRLVVVQRGDEVWATAADALVDGQWKRSTFAAPQLFQPPPGDRQWQQDFAGGPEPWRFSASWHQRGSGQVTVLGRTAPAWLVEGDLLFDGTKVHELDTFAEGSGLTSILDLGEGTPAQRWDLVAFRHEVQQVTGRYRFAGDDNLTLAVSTAAITLAIGDGPARAATNVQVDGPASLFTSTDGTGSFTWSGRQTPAGMLGTATRADGSTAVMDFVRLEDGQP